MTGLESASASAPRLSVVIPAHNPDPERLRRTLLGLRAQTLPITTWETLLVDNASARFPAADFFATNAPANLRRLSEPTLGLTSARLAGFRAARGETIVLVDDDNVLAPDYLATVLALFAQHPRVAALGGKALGEFETPPAPWQHEFLGLLALRDLGDSEQLSTPFHVPHLGRNEYPLCAPIGAGMALRRSVALTWADQLAADPSRRRFDRTGTDLISGGDNDIIMTALEHDWRVAYFPQLRLAHLIPAGRLAPDYLARLNRAIQRSWVRILALHHACPWSPIAPATVPLRQLKAWFVYRAWSSAAARIRWQGACGHFEGRAFISAVSGSSRS